ncbi:MAG: hypothetical protein ACYS8X_07495 [Planctomycetota bacterium]
MKHYHFLAAIAVVAAMSAVPAVAGDVFNMGPGLTSLRFLPVGDPRDSDDINGAGYGGVDYPYNIGTYEVTTGQYAEVFNAVAVTDTYALYSESMWSSTSASASARVPRRRP